MEGYLPGREVVILGSGDIGLIMARRLTLEGAHVIGVFEIQPYANGLPRNVLQCLEDYDIPLYLSHSVTDIKGEERLEGVVISAFDENLNPIPDTEKAYACDTLILAVGLIPENELTWMAGAKEDAETKGALVDEYFQTSVEGIFAAGNVLHVHDLVDFVSLEAEALAKNLVRYLKEGSLPRAELCIKGDDLVGQLLPKRISGRDDVTLSFRVKKPVRNVVIEIRQGETLIKRVKKAKALPAEMIQIRLKQEALFVDKDLEVHVLC